ncbi:MAG: sporulation protein YqfD [Clostridia bacterium]|nr:sporulation protein YqfD [Clostridia bacterium]
MKNAVYVSVKGLNLHLFMRKILKNGVPLTRAVKKDGEITVMLSCTVSKLFAIFGQKWYNKKKGVPSSSFHYCGFTVTVLRTYGFASLFQSVWRRIGVVAGVIAVAVFMLWYAGAVREISVSGGSPLSEERVLNVLSEMGVSQGTRRQAVHLPTLQNGLLASFPELTYVTVRLDGVRLSVSLYERKDQEVLPVADGNVYATASGRVTGVVVYSGTARVSVGDYVQAGDLLIEGCYALPDGTAEKTEASGEVYGEYDLTFSRGFFGVDIERYRSGRSVQSTSYRLFGFSVKGSESSIPFALYESETTHSYLFDGCILPIQREVRTYYELLTRAVYPDPLEYKKRLLNELYLEAEQSCAALGRIVRVSEDVSTDDSMIRLTVTVEASLNEK